MLKFKEYIQELFDQPYKTTKEVQPYGVVYTAKTKTNDTLTIEFDKALGGKNKWEIVFEVNGVYNLTNAGDEFKIFSTVISTIKSFVKDHNPTELLFSAFKTEYSRKDRAPVQTKRAKFYTAGISKLAKEIGFKYKIADAGTKYVYYMYNTNAKI